KESTRSVSVIEPCTNVTRSATGSSEDRSPAYVRASSTVTTASGRSRTVCWTKLAPMKPAPPVTRTRMVGTLAAGAAADHGPHGASGTLVVVTDTTPQAGPEPAPTATTRASGSGLRRYRRVLAVLTLAVAAWGLVWAVVTPTFRSPDE